MKRLSVRLKSTKPNPVITKPMKIIRRGTQPVDQVPHQRPDDAALELGHGKRAGQLGPAPPELQLQGLNPNTDAAPDRAARQGVDEHSQAGYLPPVEQGSHPPVSFRRGGDSDEQETRGQDKQTGGRQDASTNIPKLGCSSPKIVGPGQP